MKNVNGELGYNSKEVVMPYFKSFFQAWARRESVTIIPTYSIRALLS
jgi:hypothetical protein